MNPLYSIYEYMNPLSAIYIYIYIYIYNTEYIDRIQMFEKDSHF